MIVVAFYKTLFPLQPLHLLLPISLDMLLTPQLLPSLGDHHNLGIKMESSGITPSVSLSKTQGDSSVVLL